MHIFSIFFDQKNIYSPFLQITVLSLFQISHNLNFQTKNRKHWTRHKITKSFKICFLAIIEQLRCSSWTLNDRSLKLSCSRKSIEDMDYLCEIIIRQLINGDLLEIIWKLKLTISTGINCFRSHIYTYHNYSTSWQPT